MLLPSAACLRTSNPGILRRSYPIYISEDCLDKGDLLRQHVPGKQVLIVTNETIAPLYLERYAFSLAFQ